MIEEAKRQLANAQRTYDETYAERDEYLRIGLRDHAHDRMLSILRGASVDLLVLGQGHYVLDQNAKLAVETFSQLATWMPFFDAGHGGSLSPQAVGTLLEPTICLLLANDWSSLGRISSVGVSTGPVREVREQFSSALLSLLRLGGQRGAQINVPPIPAKFHFAGYERLLKSIAEKDNAAFESQRARLEGDYPTRQKQREPGLTWYGFGKLSQAFTFDALGTSLCHLAVRHGLTVDVDTPLYPRVFIHGART